MGKIKSFAKSKGSPRKSVVVNESRRSSENELMIWTFEKIDRSGKFAFDTKRKDMNASDILKKILDFSSRNWKDINKDTHDLGKSKHHYLKDTTKYSDQARERIEKLELADQTDTFYSIALNNKIRIIGIRDGQFFRVIWYDPNHDFYPSRKKHT